MTIKLKHIRRMYKKQEKKIEATNTWYETDYLSGTNRVVGSQERHRTRNIRIDPNNTVGTRI